MERPGTSASSLVLITTCYASSWSLIGWSHLHLMALCVLLVKCSPWWLPLFPYSLPTLALMMALIHESDIWPFTFGTSLAGTHRLSGQKRKLTFAIRTHVVERRCVAAWICKQISCSVVSVKRTDTHWPTSVASGHQTRDIFFPWKDAQKVVRVSFIDLIRNPRKAHAPHMIRL